MPKMKKKYLAEFEHRIAGIPCTIAVIYFHHQRPHGGSAHTCDSDVDWYGYTEMEFDVLDRKGYLANWLEKKMTDDDRIEIESTAMELMGHDD